MCQRCAKRVIVRKCDKKFDLKQTYKGQYKRRFLLKRVQAERRIHLTEFIIIKKDDLNSTAP
jgi:hypothetical protein